MAQNKVRLDFNLPKIKKGLDDEFEKAMVKTAYTIHNQLIRKLTGQRSGRRYLVPATDKNSLRGTSPGEGKKPTKPKYYNASKPFEPPASRLGLLRTGYEKIVEEKGMLSRAIIGSPEPYAIWLEFGTKNMAPRPHIIPAFEETRHVWEKHFEKLT